MEINMDKLNNITRRDAILGLAAGSAVAAIGVLPAVATNPSPVLATIARHKAAMRVIHRLLRRLDKLETLPGRPSLPQVRVGSLLKGRDANNEDIREPIYSYDHQDIERHAQVWIGTAFGTKSAGAYRAKFDGFHRELTRQIRALARFDRASGLTALQAEITKAYRVEAEAEAALLLALPRSAQEAATKAAYIKRSDLLTDWTESPVAYRAVMRGLCEVAGARTA
jgi:hypothetical protein